MRRMVTGSTDLPTFSSFIIHPRSLATTRGAVAQSVERAFPGQEVTGVTRCGRPLPTGWVGVSIM